MSDNSNSKSDLVAEIIANALGPLADWQPPVPLLSVGPAFPEVLTAFAKRLEELRNDLRAALSGYSFEDLEADFPDSNAPSLNPLFNRTGRHGTLAKRLAKAKAEVPQDFVGGWSVKGKEIDLSHWRGIASYSVAEAALLSVGRDPRTTFFDALFESYGRSDEADDLLYFLEDRHDAIALGLGVDPDDSTSRIGTSDFFNWIKTNKIPIDPRLRRMLNDSWKDKKATRDLPPVAQDAKDKPVHGSSLKVHARVVTAMARQKYELTREEQIGRIAKKIQHDADHLGMSFDVKVVRHLLKIGLRDYREQDPEK